jgi:NAD-dependent deacetylase
VEDETTYLIHKTQDLLRQARHPIALTGAGISTPSGIPDFRTPTSGLWSHHDPYEVASLHGFQNHPERFYEWIHPLANQILQAQPNPAHLALAHLERAGRLRALITQNIDMLHTKAGTRRLFELHGHLREAECLICGMVYTAEGRLLQFLETGAPPICYDCGAILKPRVTLFGESLPWRELIYAQHEAQQCDLLLIAGSSLEVAPANDIPLIAHNHGAKIVILNYTPTHLDHLATVILRGDIAELLPEVVAPFTVASDRTPSRS